MDFLELWEKRTLLLFLWSAACFVLGVAFTGVIYHYHLNAVIKKANKLIDQLANSEYPRDF